MESLAEEASSWKAQFEEAKGRLEALQDTVRCLTRIEDAMASAPRMIPMWFRTDGLETADMQTQPERHDEVSLEDTDDGDSGENRHMESRLTTTVEGCVGTSGGGSSIGGSPDVDENGGGKDADAGMVRSVTDLVAYEDLQHPCSPIDCEITEDSDPGTLDDDERQIEHVIVGSGTKSYWRSGFTGLGSRLCDVLVLLAVAMVTHTSTGTPALEVHLPEAGPRLSPRAPAR